MYTYTLMIRQVCCAFDVAVQYVRQSEHYDAGEDRIKCRLSPGRGGVFFPRQLYYYVEHHPTGFVNVAIGNLL